MSMTFSRETIGSWNVRVAQSRAPGKPTVVLTNALPQSIRCWESHWEDLSTRYDLIAVDLPGFGLSEGSPDVMRPSAQAEFLGALFDAMSISEAFIVGPDVGVPVALWFASENPDRVLGVNVYDGPGTWPPDFSDVLRLATRSRLTRWLGTKPPLEKRFMQQNYETASDLGYQQFEPSDAAKAEYREIAYDSAKNANALAFLGSYPEELPQLESRLPSISAPVLITWGGRDEFVLPTNAQKLHDRLPNSEVTIFEDAGHFSHEDAGDAWLQRFVRFTESVGAQRRVA